MISSIFPSNPFLPALWAAHAFLAILFLQSGLDKMSNYKANLDWIAAQFKDTLLGSMIKPVFLFLTLLELASGLSSAVVLYLLGTHDTGLCLPALSLSSITFLALFFGQRISKEYQGAASLAAYFAVNLLAFFALAQLEM